MAMSSAERSHYGGSFLSDDFQAAIQRRLRELGGLALFVVIEWFETQNVWFNAETIANRRRARLIPNV